MTSKEQLLFDYIDGILSAEEEARVEALIAEDRAMRALFSRVCLLHYGFRESLRRTDLQMMLQTPGGTEASVNELLFMESHGEALELEPEPELYPEPVLHEVDEEYEREVLAKNWRDTLIIHATVIVGIAALLVFAILKGVPETPELPELPKPPIAEVTRVIDAQWSPVSAPLGRGAELFAGTYELTSGAVQLSFASGVSVIVEAPTQFELVDVQRMNLSRGRLSARVETPVDRFVVNTPKATVVDLGTVFSVNVDERGSTDMAVFEGKVMIAPEQRTEDDKSAWVLIESGAGASVDESGGKVVVQPTLDERAAAMCARSWNEALHRPKITGAILYEENRPTSFVDEPTYDARRARLFPEKFAFELPEAVPVATEILPPVAGQQRVKDERDVIPKGTRINSYLVHSHRPPGDVDPNAVGTARDITLNMTLTFRRPVLGFVHDTASLVATDALMGLAAGPPSPQRGLEGNETVHLSPDRRTVTIMLKLGPKPDQFRIIVAAPEANS